MIRNIQNLDNRTKYRLLITTFVLALFVMFVLNVAISIIYMLDLIKQPNFETILFSIRDGYYTLNNKKIGAPIFFNIISFFVVWYLMTSNTLKNIYELDFFFNEFNEF